MHDLTPVSALVGGALITLSLGVMLVGTGRIAGLSGLFAGVLRGPAGDRGWRATFLLAALAVGIVFALARPETFDTEVRAPLWLVAVAGALVGAGTRLSNGCTSGHGLCGLSRFSKRSLVATATFFACGVATATITGRLL